MNKLIGMTFMALSVTTQTHAASHIQTLENEHRDPKSLASLLPRDIVEQTKPYLHSCPVLTVNNGVLDMITSHSSRDFDTDLSDIDKAKKVILEWADSQTPAGANAYNTKHKYIYDNVSSGIGIHLSDDSRRKSLKDVLVENNPHIELKGTFHNLEGKPNSVGPLCFYEGSMPGKYYFQFSILFRGDDPVSQRSFDRVVNRKPKILND